jgi:hypothetical protein
MEPGSIVEGLDVGEDIKLGLGTGQLRWWLSRIRYTARMGKSVRPKRRIGKTAKRGRPATGRDPSVTIRLPASLIEWIDGRADSGRSDLIRRLLEESRLRHAAPRHCIAHTEATPYAKLDGAIGGRG